MTDPTPGTAPVLAQPGDGTPAPQQPQAATPPPVQAQPSVEELKAQLAEEKKARETAENSTKHFQSEFDKLRTRAAAVTQEPPQVDPLKAHVDKLVAKGMLEADARAIAEVQYEMMRPLQQELQTARSAVQGVTQVDRVLEAAIAAKPKLFADQRVINHARQELLAAAQSGNLDYVNPEYAVVAGRMGYAMAFDPDLAQPTAPQPAQPRSLNFAGPQPGYTPAAQPLKAENPLTAQLAAQMAEHIGIPLNQQ